MGLEVADYPAQTPLSLRDLRIPRTQGKRLEVLLEAGPTVLAVQYQRGHLSVTRGSYLTYPLRSSKSQPTILPWTTSSRHLSCGRSCPSSLIGTIKRSAPTPFASFSSPGRISPGGWRQ